jgi:hypothetical protein
VDLGSPTSRILATSAIAFIATASAMLVVLGIVGLRRRTRRRGEDVTRAGATGQLAVGIGGLVVALVLALRC